MAPPVSWARILRPIGFIAAYVLAAKSTEGMTLESGFTPWYPPAGLVLAYLLLLGPRAWPTVLAARLVNTAVLFPEAWREERAAVLVRAVAITAAYAAGAHLLRRLGVDRARLQELARFVLVGVVAVPLAAAVSVGTVGLLLLDAPLADAVDAARTVWIGDAVAVLSVVPAALMVAAVVRGQRTVRLPRTGWGRLELLSQAAALVGVPVLVLVVADAQHATAWLSLAVLPVIWVAVRGDLAIATVGLLVVNVSFSLAAGTELGATARISEIQAVMLASGAIALYVVVITADSARAMASLAESEERLRTVLESAPCLVVRFDLDGQVRFASRPHWFELDCAVEQIVEPLVRDWPTVASTVTGGSDPVEQHWEVTRADGTSRWYMAYLGAEHQGDGEVSGIVATITDLTPTRQAEMELARVRWQDPLTGLANRQRFLDLLAPLAGLPDGQLLGVAMIDIDRFKAINEGVGHERADQVLVEVADRIRELVSGDGLAARLAADEFAVALPVAGAEDVVAFGDLLVRELRTRVPMGDRELFVTCSVGVACGSQERPALSVLYDAESALHAAKESGRDRCATFEAGLRLAKLEREQRMALVRRALDEGRVLVHYQPIVDLVTGVPASLEALVRLTEPNGGVLLPGSFIDLVEEAGLDHVLSAIVLDHALRDLAGWLQIPGVPPLTVSVNITSRELTEPGFVNRVLRACERHGIDPGRLRLELTETMLMADLEAAARVLDALGAHGITTAVDDFGTGYSSMAYIQRLPVDVLKIDRTFVAGLPDDDDDRSIVGLVVGLARALGLAVTAEGIETEEQRLALLELGCHHGQGFLIDRPVDAAVITARLTAIAAASSRT